MAENQNLVTNIIEMIQTFIDAVFEIGNYFEQKELEKGYRVGLDLVEALQAVKKVSEQEEGDKWKELSIRCENCFTSLKEILTMMKEEELEKAERKLEFELLPLLRIAYIRFFYFGKIKENPQKEVSFLEEAVELSKNYYIEQGKEQNRYKYDITICIIAYNQLDYTKLCVEHVLEAIPRTLRCELVLINHGSTDGTKEYFEQIQPEKQIDIKINSLDGFVIAPFVAEGEFLLIVSNDVIVSKNAIDLMVQCIKEDPQIACVVPLTPNVSNLQGILPKEIQYKDIEEFKKAAGHYNRRNQRKEENRVRLLTPICLVRTEYWTNSKKTKALIEMILGMGTAMFGDDALSLYFRRAGYKNVLIKGVYCHHFGSKTVGKTEHDFLAGRTFFYKKYGIDAWEKGFCWSPSLFQKLVCEKADAKRILGINGGLGSNALKIKEELKERTGNREVKLINYTMERRFFADLKGISDEAYSIENWEKLLDELEGSFDYILLSGGLEKESNYKRYINQLYQYLEKDGVIIVQSSEKKQVDWFEKQYKGVERVEEQEFLCCKDQTQTQYIAFCKKVERNP